MIIQVNEIFSVKYRKHIADLVPSLKQTNQPTQNKKPHPEIPFNH